MIKVEILVVDFMMIFVFVVLLGKKIDFWKMEVYRLLVIELSFDFVKIIDYVLELILVRNKVCVLP
jgi:hypothetical protein